MKQAEINIIIFEVRQVLAERKVPQEKINRILRAMEEVLTE